MKDGLHTVVDNVAKVVGGIEKLVGTRVMVGVPASKADRRDASDPINNAALAYIHDNGAPEANVPARPFMVPGIEAAQADIVDRLKKTGEAALDGLWTAVERGFNAVGLIAQAAIRNRIAEGVPPPLAESTLRKRAAAGGKGAARELADRAAGLPAGVANAKPLEVTGQLRNAISYVIRKAGP